MDNDRSPHAVAERPIANLQAQQPENAGATQNADAFALPDGRQSRNAADIARGTMRLLASLGFHPVMELTLANNRRADIAAVGPKGELWIVEVKSCLNDYRTDGKWPDYNDYCDRFFFAVDGTFPAEVIPSDIGLIIADRYGAEIVRESHEERLSGARRKAVTLRIARASAQRLHGLLDPEHRISSRF